MGDYDGFPGHALHGVPQAALEAARQVLADACGQHAPQSNVVVFDKDDIDSVADAVVAACREKLHATREPIRLTEAAIAELEKLPQAALNDARGLLFTALMAEPDINVQEHIYSANDVANVADTVILGFLHKMAELCDSESRCLGSATRTENTTCGGIVTDGAEKAPAGSLPGVTQPPNPLDRLRERRAMEPEAYYDVRGLAACPNCDASVLAGSKVPVRLTSLRRKGLLWFRRTVGTCPRCLRTFWVRLP